MGTAVARWSDRWSAATGYVVALAAATLALATRPSGERSHWLDWSSTSLANLHDHPIRAMLFSGVLSEGTIVGWVAMALVGLGACGVTLGAWRTLLLVGSAHVLGTLVSQGIVDYRIAHGALAASAAHMRDIGPSYIITAAVVAGVAYGRRAGQRRVPGAAAARAVRRAAGPGRGLGRARLLGARRARAGRAAGPVGTPPAARRRAWQLPRRTRRPRWSARRRRTVRRRGTARPRRAGS